MIDLLQEARKVKLYYSFGQPPAGIDVLWRCEARRYSYTADADAEREVFGTTNPRLEMQWWSVKHRTPKGARLNIGTFVNLTATKRWACNTQAEALESFMARKRKQISILSHRIVEAEKDLELGLRCAL